MARIEDEYLVQQLESVIESARAGEDIDVQLVARRIERRFLDLAYESARQVGERRST